MGTAIYGVNIPFYTIIGISALKKQLVYSPPPAVRETQNPGTQFQDSNY